MDARSRQLLRLASAAVVLALISTVTGYPFATTRAAARDSATTTANGEVRWKAEPSAKALAAYAQPQRHSEQFYFLLPDRFANGNPGNDTGGRTGDRLSTGYDPTDQGFYHGGDLQGVIDRLDYIAGLGTTAIWLAPVFTNQPVQGTGQDASAGYHGYWITDFTQVDPHFGSNADLKRLVDVAHRRGIKIFLDVIVNHTADVLTNQQGQYEYQSKTDAPYTDRDGQPFDDANYADGSREFPGVDASSFPSTPAFTTAAAATAKAPAWLNDPTMYHNRGDSTFSGESSQYGDFYGLDDLWTERPEVVRGMTKIYSDWIARSGIDGYRIDTVKHVNDAFWPQFTAGIAAAAAKRGNRDFYQFGEVYSADPEIDAEYVRTGGLGGTLDFPFQAAASGYVARGGSASDLASLYVSDSLYTTRTTDAGSLPTFLGNHDMGRIGYAIASGGQDQDTALQRSRLGHELMFLSRGQPVVYAGDEQGFVGSGGDKDARQDLFATQVAAYADQPRIGTTATGATDSYDQTHPLYRTIATLAALRAEHPGLRTGTQITRYAADGPGVFAFSRLDADQRVEYLIATNNAATAQTVALPTSTAGATFQQIYPAVAGAVPGAAAQQGRPRLTTGVDTTMSVTVPALATVVFQATAALAKPEVTASLALSVAPQSVTRADLSAALAPESAGTTVTYAARVGDGPWRLLGSATSAPYRIHHDLTGL
ncbi:MAG: DUF3372 domain-containing protein, partial [Micromonosporaceae bacterium]|nr:DUF3372 domain-containing protein [Micromonosporaceae bacterium]